MRNITGFDGPIGDPFDRSHGRVRYCDPVTAITAGVGLISADKQRSSANKAADAQREAAQTAAQQQQQAFDTVQENLAPYRALGQQGISGVQGLLGLSGPEAQQQAIGALQGSPQYQTLVSEGENAMLQNSAATGGLRGGNLQASLQRFRPQLLNQLIEQRYSQLGGLLGAGQNAAAGIGQAAINTGQSLGNLSQAMGAYGAGAELAGGRAQAGLLRDIGGMAGQIGARPGGFGGFFGGFNPFGGTSITPQSYDYFTNAGGA